MKRIEEFQVNITNWEELAWKCCILYDFKYMTFWKDRIIETIKRSVVAWS